MCVPKGYGLVAVLVGNRVSILGASYSSGEGGLRDMIELPFTDAKS